MTQRAMPLKPTIDPVVQQQLLLLLARRAQGFADAVKMGDLGFVDAVIILADAARNSGLADGVSDERLQRAIGWAFMGPLPKPANQKL